jgi:hypothetical protein
VGSGFSLTVQRSRTTIPTRSETEKGRVVKVRCDRILDRTSGGEVEITEHPTVTVGNEYVVTQLLSAPGKELEIAILDNDEGSVGSQWPARMFSTIDVSIPSNFAIRVYDDGRVQIAPRSWLRDEFWDEVTGSPGTNHEDALRSIADWRRELEVIKAES